MKLLWLLLWVAMVPLYIFIYCVSAIIDATSLALGALWELLYTKVYEKAGRPLDSDDK